jgi:hypothetical protein
MKVKGRESCLRRYFFFTVTVARLPPASPHRGFLLGSAF